MAIVAATVVVSSSPLLSCDGGGGRVMVVQYIQLSSSLPPRWRRPQYLSGFCELVRKEGKGGGTRAQNWTKTAYGASFDASLMLVSESGNTH